MSTGRGRADRRILRARMGSFRSCALQTSRSEPAFAGLAETRLCGVRAKIDELNMRDLAGQIRKSTRGGAARFGRHVRFSASRSRPSLFVGGAKDNTWR